MNNNKFTINCTKNYAGLHIITGAPGVGKTFLIKYIAYKELPNENSIIVTSTIGASTARITRFAKIAHFQFSLPRKMMLFKIRLCKAIHVL